MPTPTSVPASTTITLEVEGGVVNNFLDWTSANSIYVTGYRVLRAVNGLATVTLSNQTTDTDYIDEKIASEVGQSNAQICYTVEGLAADKRVVAHSNPACAHFGVVQLWVPRVKGQPGALVTVPINIRHESGIRISDSDIWLSYDPGVLAYQSITATVLTAGYQAKVTMPQAGQLHITTRPVNAASPAELYGAGSLFALTFQVIGLAGTQSALGLSESTTVTQTGFTLTAWATNNSPNNVTLNLQGGNVIVEDKPIYFRGDVNGDGAMTQADVQQTQHLIDEAQGQSLEALNAGDMNGNARLDGGDAALIAYAVKNGNWPTVASTGATNQTDPVTVTLMLDTVDAMAGPSVTTTLQADSLPNITAGEFFVVYDPAVIEKIVAVQSPINGVRINSNTNPAGLLHITVVAATPLHATDALFTLALQLRPNAQPGLTPLILADATLYDKLGRDFVHSFTNHRLSRKSTTLQIQVEGKIVYLPTIMR